MKLKYLSLLLALFATPAFALDDASIPTKIPIYWGASAPGGQITCPQPNASQIGITAGRSSWPDGFPPLTFLPQGAGGVPPFGQDFNGVLCQISQWSRWFNAGAPVPYDGTFQSAIGGYPKGAIVPSATTFGIYWVSTVDNNTNNPDTGGSGWAFYGVAPLSTVTGASHLFTSTDAGSQTKRSNSGAAMADTLPGTGAGVLPATATIRACNADTSSMYVLTSLSGAALRGGDNGFLYLGPGQCGAVVSDGSNYTVTQRPDRAKLGANTTFFYSTTGLTSNNGLTASLPWTTASYAYSFLQAHFDLNGFVATVQAGSGTYSASEQFTGPLVGQVSASSIIIQGSGGVTYSTTTTAFQATQDAKVSIQGFTIASAAAGSCAMVAAYRGEIDQQANTFNTCTLCHMQAIFGSLIITTGSYSISGPTSVHILVGDNSVVTTIGNPIVTIGGGVGWGSAFASTTVNGSALLSGLTFSGTATGVRYLASLNSVIFTNGGGANFLPGNLSGSTTSGGQYN